MGFISVVEGVVGQKTSFPDRQRIRNGNLD